MSEYKDKLYTKRELKHAVKMERERLIAEIGNKGTLILVHSFIANSDKTVWGIPIEDWESLKKK